MKKANRALHRLAFLQRCRRIGSALYDKNAMQRKIVPHPAKLLPAGLAIVLCCGSVAKRDAFSG